MYMDGGRWDSVFLLYTCLASELFRLLGLRLVSGGYLYYNNLSCMLMGTTANNELTTLWKNLESRKAEFHENHIS